MTDLRVTGPNSDGEYWLHIEAGGMMGGINLGASHEPMVQRLLDAAAIEAPVQEPVAHWYTGPTEEQATAALRAKLAEVERERDDALDQIATLLPSVNREAVEQRLRAERAEADRDEERKLADDLAAELDDAWPKQFRPNPTLARHAARRKEQG